MRTVQQPLIQRCSYSVKRNGVQDIQGSSIGTRSHQFLRPDVVKNPVVNGFRQPSDYYASNDQNALRVYAQMVGKTTFNNLGSTWVSEFDQPVATSGISFPNVTSSDLYLAREPWRVGFAHGVDLPLGMAGRVDTKALLNVANRQAALSESVAELRSTFTGLADNAHAINKFVTALIKRDVRGMSKSLGLSKSHRANSRARKLIRSGHAGAKLAGGLWLNYFFGLAPIVDDMVLGMRAAADTRLGQTLRVKGSATEVLTMPVSKKWVSPSYTRTPSVTTELRYTKLVGQKTSLWYALTNERLRELALYGATDVATTAWALVPLSFVVDWVIPVSSVLKAIESTWGLTYITGTRTTFGVAKDFEVTVKTDHGSIDVSGVEVRGDRATLRTVLKTPPSPQFWINDPCDMWKAITSLALLANSLTLAFSDKVSHTKGGVYAVI